MILVCTTIIETGVDIAQRQHPHHRGRRPTWAWPNCTRSGDGWAVPHRRAYAYLTYRRGKVLIGDLPPSGCPPSGSLPNSARASRSPCGIWRSAGRATCWARNSSGHMLSVGYDLYLKLLEEAVAEAGGAPARPHTECSADLLVSASLPANYVPDSGQRVDLYRRIALIRNRDDYDDMVDEMLDRYGDPPQQAINLLDIALLRAKAGDCGISELTQRDGRLIITFQAKDITCAALLCSHPSFKGRMLLSAGAAPYLSLILNKKESPLAQANQVVSSFFDLYQEQERATIEENKPTEERP